MGDWHSFVLLDGEGAYTQVMFPLLVCRYCHSAKSLKLACLYVPAYLGSRVLVYAGSGLKTTYWFSQPARTLLPSCLGIGIHLKIQQGPLVLSSALWNLLQSHMV